MSDQEWMAHLEFEEGTSSKFWRARVEGRTLYVNYGKIGSNGQTQVKDFADNAGATKEFDKLVREKRKKGYIDAGGEGGGGGGDDEDEEIDDDEGGDDDEEESRPAPRAAKPAPAAAPAARPAGGTRMLLEAGSRKVETHLVLDGKTVRMDSIESYASPEAAKKAFERLKKTLAGEGYKEG
jgi:predicted DNA-binding WGR domain protein